MAEKIPGIEGKLSMMKTFYVGFINNPQLELDEFGSRIEKAVAQYPRFTAVFSSEDAIQIGKAVVDLSTSAE